MNTVGIIAEFNPFHEGHSYLIRRAKELTRSSFAVVVMNGDFVQRGEPAVFDKYARTRAALQGGADLVLELPVRFGVASAGDFATGGVMALSALGFVTHLAFGSECGEIGLLQEAASALLGESDDFRSVLSDALRHGASYPAARARALAATAPVDQELFRQPNNILGVEYCLAVQKLASPLTPVTVLRKGMGYHDTAGTSYPSATALRQDICTGDTPHLELDDFSAALGYALAETANLARYKDVSPDLADRILHFLPSYRTASEFTKRCQTRAFTAGRIRRALIQCLLHIENSGKSMPYLRLLGMKKDAASLLSQVPDSCRILSRLATDGKTLESGALPLLQQDLFASDLYRQTWCRKYRVELPNEYQHSLLKN